MNLSWTLTVVHRSNSKVNKQHSPKYRKIPIPIDATPLFQISQHKANGISLNTNKKAASTFTFLNPIPRLKGHRGNKNN